MKSALLVSLAALALCGATAPASATAVTYTFSGSLISGHDNNNLFGLGNGSLAGDAYKVVETFSDLEPVGVSSTSFISAGDIDVSVTVGSGTHSWTLDQFATVDFTPGSSLDTSIIPAPIFLALNIGAKSTDIGSTLSSFSAGPANASISGDLNYFLPTSPLGDTSLTFGNATISAVPLPPALPMFGTALLGLGALGYGLTRNRKASLPV